MAAGDIWQVNTSSGLNVRSEASVASAKLYTMTDGTQVTEIEIKDGWLKHSGGWSSLSYLIRVDIASSPEVVDTPTSGSSGPTQDGYVPDTGYLFDGVGLEDNGMSSDSSYREFSRIKNVAGVFGLPYQFLPTADLRISNPLSNETMGFEYADKIIKRIPFLLISPGKANFMAEYSKSEKESILERVLTVNSNNNTAINQGTIDDLLEDEGRYYTFEYDKTRYYQFVNPMCRIAARYLNVQDVVIDGESLDAINWETFTKRRISSIADMGDFSAIPFYVDSETSVSESFSNSTTQSMIASTVNSISDMGRELNFLLGYGASATGAELLAQDADIASNIENVQNTIDKLLGQGNFMSNLANHLTTVAAGGKLTFPEIWSDSQFSRSYNCEFKFIAPDPSNLSVYLNVIVPLLHLIGLVAPQSVAANPNGYTNPFLVRAIYKGFFNVDMGIITDMSVTKGAECQWTTEGIPTSINVSISIKDLYQAMSITPTTSGKWKYDTLNNMALMDYIANLCGVNVYKPEVTRMIEMWYMNNFYNRVADFFQVSIWQNVQDKIQNAVINIYR